MIRRPPRSTLSSSSAASDVYKRQARKALAGLGNKQGEFQRARVDTHSGLSMRIESAEVSKLVTGSKGDPTFVVLGKIVAQDLAERANAQELMDKIKAMNPEAGEQQLQEEAEEECPQLVDFDQAEPSLQDRIVDPTQEHVEMVMVQTGVTSRAAGEALRKSGNDVVNAIMSLSG
eukprot:TRINITY_DN7295_c0_g1_i6.p1 TRINITY_DN7295_c0_g1~~TRINITY_DN7295_c0_g1_i6.p1  ORF type:complete len:175 (+),score=54.14 TRINITY_DN7295_c0_g1_i6:87-611(+)